MANTSGQGSLVVVPDEIKGWNWGAFFLTFIWGASNKVWSSALVGVPGIGALVPFVIGVKGSEWAWQNKEWESVEHFKEVQRKWAIWGFAIFIASIVICFAIGFNGGFDDEDEAYQYEAEAPSLNTPVAKGERTAAAAPVRSPNEAAAIAVVAPAVSPPPALPAALETTSAAPAAVVAPDAGKESQVTETATPKLSDAPRKTYASGDLRECLDHQTNEDIARCAERF